MPFVTVKLVGKLNREQKEDLVKGISGLIEKVTGKEIKYTQVVIEEVDRENWGKDGKLLG